MKMSPEISELLKAIQSAREIVGEALHKGTKVGYGNSAYSSINDEQVRRHTREALQAAGLIIFPVGVEANTSVDAWTDDTGSTLKRKYRSTTNLLATYRVCHVESGQWMEGQSFGIGVDQADKGAGKAQTYALKTFVLDLLYLVKSKEEDGDRTHSEEYGTPTGAAALNDERTFIKEEKQIVSLQAWIEQKHQQGAKKTDINYILNQKYAMPRDIVTRLNNYMDALFNNMK